jgi:hypothetical protein
VTLRRNTSPARGWSRRALLVGLALLAMACAGPTPSRSPASSAFTLHPFPGLESKLPHTVAGKTLITTSLRPSEQTASPKTLALLTRLGKTVDDLQLASASVSGVDIAITALRISGFDAHKILATVQLVDEADPQHITVYGTTTVDGKPIVTRTVGGTVYDDYASVDTVFEMSGSAALVAEALGQLP